MKAIIFCVLVVLAVTLQTDARAVAKKDAVNDQAKSAKEKSNAEIFKEAKKAFDKLDGLLDELEQNDEKASETDVSSADQQKDASKTLNYKPDTSLAVKEKSNKPSQDFDDDEFEEDFDEEYEETDEQDDDDDDSEEEDTKSIAKSEGAKKKDVAKTNQIADTSSTDKKTDVAKTLNYFPDSSSAKKDTSKTDVSTDVSVSNTAGKKDQKVANKDNKDDNDFEDDDDIFEEEEYEMEEEDDDE